MVACPEFPSPTHKCTSKAKSEFAVNTPSRPVSDQARWHWKDFTCPCFFLNLVTSQDVQILPLKSTSIHNSHEIRQKASGSLPSQALNLSLPSILKFHQEAGKRNSNIRSTDRTPFDIILHEELKMSLAIRSAKMKEPKFFRTDLGPAFSINVRLNRNIRYNSNSIKSTFTQQTGWKGTKGCPSNTILNSN